MQQIHQTINNKSQQALIQMHIPGSDMNGQPLAQFINASAPNEERGVFSPNLVPHKTKVKIERKKIQGSTG